jgi:hypothetical protein
MPGASTSALSRRHERLPFKPVFKSFLPASNSPRSSESSAAIRCRHPFLTFADSCGRKRKLDDPGQCYRRRCGTDVQCRANHRRNACQHPPAGLPGSGYSRGGRLVDGRVSIVTAYAEDRDLGAAATAAEFLSFIDADDLWAPSKIALQMNFHRRTRKGLAKQIYFYMRGHSAALLVQHERTGVRSNLKQAFKWKPLWYLGRVRRRLFGRSVAEDRFLWQEIAGYVSGLLIYLRTRRG